VRHDIAQQASIGVRLALDLDPLSYIVAPMNGINLRWILVAALLCSVATGLDAAAFGRFKADKVVFIGDSITHAGHYVSVIEARLRELNDNQVPAILNLGLPSETCSGLSEPDHPFPRPDVHERLDRVLAETKPDLVFACYGMNDGIYHPFSDERFSKFQEGINLLIRKVKASGAKLVLITPPPFDPLPLRKKDKLLPAGREKYAWFEIYEGYDDVLDRYAKWLHTRRSEVDGLVDVRPSIQGAVAKARKQNPDFTLSNDGVHIDRAGHQIFARAVMKELGIGTDLPDSDLLALVEARHQATHLAWLTKVGHQRPGPNSKIPFAESMAKKAAVEKQIGARFASDWSSRVKFPASEQSVELFNGRNLDGWEGLDRFWSVENGQIRGANAGRVIASTYLFTEKSYREFRLVFEVKQTMGKSYSTMHSAICALGSVHSDAGGRFGYKGHLLMFCHDWGIWDAYQRNRIYPPNHKGGYRPDSEKKGGWNQIEVLVIGNRIRFVNNGELVIDFEDDPKFLKASPLGLQLHKNARPQEFRFRGLILSENPEDRLVTLQP
jgi:lysophospholipase L1-like esterase